MKTLIATIAAAVVITAWSSPTFAAPKHRNQVDATRTYGAARSGAYGATNGSAVILGNRVLGQDPDPNIRLQILRDPNPGNY